MPRQATVTVQVVTLKDGTKRYRPKIGREIVGVYVDTREEAMANGLVVFNKASTPTGEEMTVGEFHELWTRNPGPFTTTRGRGPTTIRHLRERTGLFAKEHADLPLAAITRPLALLWAERHPQRAGAVRTMFADAHDMNLVSANVFARLKIKGMSKPARDKIQALTEPELHDLAEMARVIPNEMFRPMMRNYVLIAGYTGMRLGETTALKWSDVDFDNGTIQVARQWLRSEAMMSKPKSGKGRRIALFPGARTALEDLRAHYGEDFSKHEGEVFASPRRARLNARNHFYYWSMMRCAYLDTLPLDRLEELKGPDGTALHWHDLRHFCGSWLTNLGLTNRDVAEQLGHNDGGILVAKLYGHTYNTDALARLQAGVNGHAEPKVRKRRSL